MDSSYNDYFDFISKIVKNGITATTYAERAKLILDKINPKITKTHKKQFTVDCESTVYKIVDSVFVDFPTITNKKLSKTMNEELEEMNQPDKPNVCIKYQTPNGRIENLQQYLNDCCQREDLKYSAIDKQLSDMHIFIDVMTWNGRYTDLKQHQILYFYRNKIMILCHVK